MDVPKSGRSLACGGVETSRLQIGLRPSALTRLVRDCPGKTRARVECRAPVTVLRLTRKLKLADYSSILSRSTRSSAGRGPRRSFHQAKTRR